MRFDAIKKGTRGTALHDQALSGSEPPKNWHNRGLNMNADYGYVILEAVEFYLHKCKPLEEYVPSQEQDDKSPSTCISMFDTRHHLTFSFVCD